MEGGAPVQVRFANNYSSFSRKVSKPPPTDTMANPVTSIVNPTGESVLRFWVTAKQQLALSQTPIDDKHGEQTLKYRANGTPAGNHAPNQCIAAVYLRGMVSLSRAQALGAKGGLTRRPVDGHDGMIAVCLWKSPQGRKAGARPTQSHHQHCGRGRRPRRHHHRPSRLRRGE